MNRIEKIAKVLPEIGADAILITSDNNRLYAAAGFSASRGQVLVTGDGEAYYLTDSRYLQAAEKTIVEKGFHLVDNTLGEIDGINALIRKHGIKILSVENMQMTMDVYARYQTLLHAELVGADTAVDALRASLTAEEREQLQYAQSLAEKALANTCLLYTSTHLNLILKRLVVSFVCSFSLDPFFQRVIEASTNFLYIAVLHMFVPFVFLNFAFERWNRARICVRMYFLLTDQHAAIICRRLCRISKYSNAGHSCHAHREQRCNHLIQFLHFFPILRVSSLLPEIPTSRTAGCQSIDLPLCVPCLSRCV